MDILGPQDAAAELLNFVLTHDQKPIAWSNWYVGISGNPVERLKVHRAIEGQYSVVGVESGTVARAIEKFFIEFYHMGGYPCGGDDPRFVYVFKKRPDTDPPL